MGTISTHLHANTTEFCSGIAKSLHKMAGGLKAESNYLNPLTIGRVVEDMDQFGIEKSVLLPLDLRTTGDGFVPNDHIADLVRQHPKRLIGFGCVDPHMGDEAIKELERCVNVLGLKGLGEMDGSKQDFVPSERQYFPLFDRCQELDIPVVFHTGNSPGYPIEYASPVYIDRLAYNFPRLRICLAHMGWPWADIAAAIAWNKPNVYLDINAIRLKYLSAAVVNMMNTVISDKVLFAHDFPVFPTAKMVKEFDELPLRPEIKKKIREDNPKRFLGI
ncbi:MAG: amidohydrolase [Chloroflexi bacterium]|nr:amidohydrolase [Chloroflexota bacterium]